MSETLSDKAKQCLGAVRPNDLLPFLSECVAARSTEALCAVKMLAREMYGGCTFNFELKAPAAYCLLAWREGAFSALLDNCRELDQPKNYSLAFHILCAFASGRFPSGIEKWINDTRLVQEIVQTIGDPTDLQDHARRCLNELVMSIPGDDDIAGYLGTVLHSFALTESSSIKPLIQSLSLRWTAIGTPIISAYQRMLAESSNDEPAFQAFFELHPSFLDPLALRVWPKPDFHGKKEPDFLVQRSDNSYVIVEIETPAKQLVTASGQITAETTHAVTQVLEYRSYLVERFSHAAITFPDFTTPDALVIIGCEAALSSTQRSALRRENEHRHCLRIMGFDSLGDRALAITKNVIDTHPCIHKARLH